MALTDEVQKKLEELPETVRVFLYSFKFADRNGDIFKRHGIEDRPVINKILDLEREIFAKVVPITSLFDELRIRLKWQSDRAKVLALQIASEQMLPVADFLGDVPGLIQSLGGDVTIAKPDRVAMTSLTVDEAVEKVITGVHPGVTDPAMSRRMREALVSFFRSARTESQTKETLMRGGKIGGAGLEAGVADRLVAEASLVKKMVKIEEKVVPSVVARPSNTPPILPARLNSRSGGPARLNSRSGGPSAPLLPSPRRGEEVLSPPPRGGVRGGVSVKGSDIEITREISHIEKAVLPGRVADASVAVPLHITDATRRLMEEFKGVVSLELVTRLETAVSARLRDVRDTNETKELLARAVASGGLGLSGEKLDTVIDRLEKTDREIHEKLQESQEQSKRQWVRSSQEAVTTREAARAEQEVAERDAVYAKVAGGAKKVVSNSTPPTLPSAPLLPSPRGGEEVLSPPPRGGVRGGAIKTPISRPQLHDVKPTIKLVGPVEEIALMTPDQFRRLGATPADAARRLMDKVEVLRSESFVLRNDAIKAWQRSPAVALYKEIAAESLTQGKPIAAILDERSKSGKPSFSRDEFNAIIELNRRLRF